MNVIRKTYNGVKGLLSGMALTLRYFVRFDKVITQQYPENRAQLKLPPRYRGKLELVRDPATGQYKCSACGICVKACPNNSIVIEKERDPETKKMKLTQYEYHFERCTLCGLCVEACKFGAIRMGQQFENAVFTREELVQILNEDAQIERPVTPRVDLNKPASPGGTTSPVTAAREPAANSPLAESTRPNPQPAPEAKK